MTLRVRLLSRLLILLCACFLMQRLSAQDFNGKSVKITHPSLAQEFKACEVWQVDVAQLNAYVKKENGTYGKPFQLQLGKHNWQLELVPSNIFSPDYTLQVWTDDGLKVIKPTENTAFKGYDLKGGGQARLTLNKDFMAGYVMEGKKKWYIEPMYWHDPKAARNLFVLYDRDDVIYNENITCGTEELEENLKILQQKREKHVGGAESNAVVQLEYAIASDKSMFTKYGSVSAVQDHNIAVVNDVEGDYTGNFDNDLCISIVTQFVVTGTDPWSSTTNAGALLDAFRTWGQAGNFGVTFDNAALWTNRDFDGATIGIAYLNGICNSNKYHCLQDFTSNSELLRCLNSHEMGHNFSLTHDGTSGSCPPNFIMCPFVSTSTNWSGTSVSQFNSYSAPRIANGCLSSCGPPPPPLVADFSWSPNPACTGQQVQFTDLSIGNITSRNWVFPGGTPASSTQTNPVVTWATPGTKNVVLTLNGAGGPVSTTKQVIISPAAVANFTYTVSGLTLTFNNTSTNANGYEWDFGDSGFSTETSPVYTYSDAGFYTVVLTAFNDCGSTTKTLIINTAPTAEFTASPTTGCTPLVVSFQNLSSTNAVSYQWQFQGGIPSASSLANPNVTYLNAGNFNVTLTAINGFGTSTVVKTAFIKTLAPPGPGFNYAANGLNVSFSNTSTSATSYAWNFGDSGTSTLANPTHTYAAPGTYTVTLTASNAYCNATTTQTITVMSNLAAVFTAAPTSGCGPLTVQFNNASTGASQYTWQFPGGTPATSTAQSPSVVYATPGTYSVTLTASNGTNTSTATQAGLITVFGPPTAGFTSSSSGFAATFTNTTTPGGTAPASLTYAWTFGDAQTSTSANPTHTYGADGVYSVRLIATNSCGSDTMIQTVTIVTPPTANFTAIPTSGCAGLTVQFTSTSSTNASTYSWQFPGGTPATSTVQNPVVVYSTPGTYSVTLTVGNAAGTNSATKVSYITVNTTPTPGFTSSTSGATATFTNTSTNATSYSWNFGDSGTSTSASPSHTYTADGIYTVILSATNACGTVTSTSTVTIVTPPTANFTATPTSGCAPLTVQYTSTSSTNATTFSWQFPGGNPTSSTVANPVVVYAVAGTYSVTLTAGNAAGTNSAVQTSYVTVTTVPTAGFTSSTNGATVSFTNTSTGGVSYAWAFGDSGTSTNANPTHTYTTDGTYTVTLTTTNACGSTTSTNTVTVTLPPTAGFNAPVTSGCAPLTVTFNNTSSSNATTFAWQFPGGTPSTSTAQNPTVTYNAPGLYTVILTAGNAAGSTTATQTNYVSVGTVPATAFSTTVSGSTATFTNSSTGATSYSWDFGDNTGSTSASPSHNYLTDGTYTVVLTATNVCGTSTFSQNVVIITSPNAGFTAQTTTGCANLTVQFQDLSSSNTTAWAWTLPGGNPATSTVQNPTVTYDTPGVYDVTLVATGPGGTSTFTQPGFITVLGVPLAGIGGGTPIGATVTLTNNSVNATSVLWNFGDNSTSSADNPTHTYTADGTYTVTLTATNNCGTATATQSVTIVTPPTANYTQSATSGCSPLSVQFTNQSTSNATVFLWNFPGGTPATSTEQNPTAVFTQPGTYTVTLTAGNAAGSSTSTSQVTVQPLPTASFTGQGAGLSIVFTNTSTNATTYAWTFGDGGISTDVNPTHIYTLPGTYPVTLKATSICGVTETTQQIVVQGTAPISQFSAGETAGCVPLNVSFTDQSAGGPTAWKWSFPGGNPASSTLQHPTITYSVPGTYDVTLEVTNQYGTNSATRPNYITVQAFPTSNFSYTAASGTITFSNTSTNAIAYSWNFGDNTPISTEANPTHTYAKSGIYTVELTAVNNCGASTFQQMIMVTVVGVQEATWVNHFSLFPNPNNGQFTIEMRGVAQDEVEFTFFNAIGQTVRREVADFGIGSLTRTFDYAQLPAGVYALRVRAGEEAMWVKVAVQR